MLKQIVNTSRLVINMAVGPLLGLVGEAETAPPEQLRTVQQEVCKETLDDWKDSAAEYIRSELFVKKQFVRDSDLVFGGNIQKLVCISLNIAGETRARIFWDDKGGKETVRNTFRRKRQSAQNAMKLAFRGK
jgi:hypothetical protein